MFPFDKWFLFIFHFLVDELGLWKGLGLGVWKGRLFVNGRLWESYGYVIEKLYSEVRFYILEYARISSDISWDNVCFFYLESKSKVVDQLSDRGIR